MKHRRFYAFLFVSLVLFTLLMLTTLREARTQAPYQVTFTATGLDSDAGSNTVLTLGGTNYAWNTLPVNFEVDSEGTTFTWASTVSGGSGKQFVETGDSGLASPITASGTDAATYKTQYQVTFTATGLDSDAGSNTVLTLGGTNYAYNALPSSVYVDSGTTFSWTATVSGGSGKQFVETGSSGASPIMAAGTYSATYKTQWSVTFQQSGLSSDASGTVLTVGSSTYTYSTFPSSAIWVDDGTTFSYTSPVPAGSGKQYVSTGVTGVSSPVHSSGTVTGSYETQYQHTITSSPATGSGYVTVDGGAVTTPYTTPWWDSGSSHTIAANSPVTLVSGQSQYIYSSWSDSGAQSHSVSPTAVTTYTAVFQLQYYFSVSSTYDNPTGAGWYNAGSSVSSTITRPVSDGTGIQYETTGWTGTGSLSSGGSAGSSSTGSSTLNAYTTCTWNWKTQCYLTVTSPYDSPTPASGWFDSGSSITESVTSPTPGPSGTQYVCTGWTGTGSVPASGISSSVPFTITAASSITWNWKTQYYLTVTSAHDSPTPLSGWFDSGSSITESVTSPASGGAGTQYACTGWTGTGSVPVSGSGSSVTFTIGAPSTITWNWKTQYQVTFDQTGVGSDFAGAVASVDSVNYGVSSLPVSLWLDSGSSHSFSFASPLIVGSKQYVWSSTSGLSPLQSGTLTVTASGNVVGNYIIQNQVTFDKVGVSSDFTGTVVIIDSVSYSRLQLPVSFSWSVGSTHSFAFQSPLVVGSTTKQYLWTSTSGLSSVQSGSITITTYGNIISNYKTQYYLTVSSPHDSPSPVSSWFDSGSSITESVTSPVSGGSGTQYVCTGWTGTGSVPASGTASSITFTIATPSSITWNWKTQYYLTVSSPYDSPTPLSGWFDSGSSITDSVTSPVSGGSGIQFVCTGWSGAGSVPASGSATSVTFTIVAPSSISWNWKTQYYLTVSSPYDSPTPLSWWFDSGSSIIESVTSPVSDGSGTHYICTGWTGTGSVPSSGSSSSVTFTITGTSSITWNWQVVQRRLTVSSAHDSPNPGNGLHIINDGTSVTCGVSSPVTESGTVWTCTGWTGTGSVPSSGSDSSVTFTVTQDSTITWNWHGNAVQHTLTVFSAHDNPSPAVGDHLYDEGDSVTCSVTSPVTEGGVAYVCTGWTGTGSVPSSGSDSSVTFTISQDSSITWNWQIVLWNLTVSSAHGSPSPAVGDYLYNDSASVTCSVSSPVVEAGVSYTCTGWVGSGSVPSSGSGVSVTFSITQNSSITWSWVVTPPVQWNLGVVSAHGSPSPGVGDRFYDDGSSVTCSVVSPVVEGGVSYTCTGWVGTGSVPSSGSDTSTTFTITENSTITWSWVVTPPVQWNLTVSSAHDSPSPGVGNNPYGDGSSVTCSVTSPVTEAGQVWTCTGWVGSGSVPSSGSGSFVTFTITENSTITWNWQVRERPTIGSCDGTGAQKDVFNSDETVYVTGTGYAPNQTYNIYVVNDTAWVDGMTIPARIQGTVTSVSSDSSGNINLTAVWNKSLTPGKYDILVDVNGNGKYDADVDALYNNKIVTTAGFSLIPEYLFGTILGLAGCFAALGAFRMYKRKRR